MTVFIFLLITVIAAALQATVSTFAITGHAPLPFLLSVVIYYALMHRTSRMVTAAIIIGLLDDCLGMKPLGFTAFCYAATGLVIAYFRDVMAIRSTVMHAFLGAVSTFGIALATWVLLAGAGQIHLPWPWLLLKLAGSLLTGGVLTPLICAALFKLDRLIDHGGGELQSL